MEFGTAQVLTIGVCVSIHAPVDFSLLKKCLAEEVCRLECLRVQFTTMDEDGMVRQYLVAVSYTHLSFAPTTTITVI